MGLFDVLFRSRDKPVTDSINGSGYRFLFGGSTSGKRVNERSAMQMTAVYSCVRILSEAVAGLPLHLYRYNKDGGKEKAIEHAALIDLCTDICKRNGIKKLLWKADKSLIGQVDKQNMTVHRWFANKSCPGDYLYNRHSEIAELVNKRLSTDEKADAKGLQAPVFKDIAEADVIKKVGSLFTADQKASGVLASVSLAQFILESGYGKSELAQNANNVFGMKKSLSGNTWSGSSWDGKSVYGHQVILKPLLRTLRGMDDKDRLLRIQELDICIEGNTDRKQILTSLMATGVLEPTVFNKENAALVMEEQKLRAEKEKLVNFVGGDKTRIKELQKLMAFTSKGMMLTAFEDETFLAFVESITVESRTKIVFHLKCGLNLTERLVN